jgi:hypothetical protein
LKKTSFFYIFSSLFFFKQVESREIGSRKRQRVLESHYMQHLVVLPFTALVEKMPRLRNGVILGFTAGGDLLFVCQENEQMFVELLFVAGKEIFSLCRVCIGSYLRGDLSSLFIETRELCGVVVVSFYCSDSSLVLFCVFSKLAKSAAVLEVGATQPPALALFPDSQTPGAVLLDIAATDVFSFSFSLREGEEEGSWKKWSRGTVEFGEMALAQQQMYIEERIEVDMESLSGQIKVGAAQVQNFVFFFF